jgi:hypothetical protein
MALSADAVLTLAPDSSSASAGKKLADPRHWKSLGKNTQAIWGECQGSALYQVRADLTTLSAKCSCPSRKLPCKHSLGLLLLAAAKPDALPAAEPPEWVASWLARRTTASAPAQPKETKKSAEQVAAEQAKRAEKRLALARDGLDTLDLWLCDLVRNGLASVETQGTKPWETQAARMVDAQARSVGERLRRIGTIPGSRPDWPAKLLGEMGKLTLLAHAFRRLESLDPPLQEDVRGLIDQEFRTDKAAARGEAVAGDWLVLGQWIEELDNRLRALRTWLVEAATGRPALILQFSVAGAPFAETYLPGTRFPAELHYWPSRYPLRARIAERRGEPAAIADSLPGVERIEAYLGTVAGALARQPWLDRFPCVLRNVTPGCATGGEGWHVRDGAGDALPLAGGEHWRLMALSGGNPVDLAGEWDGEALLPLGVLAEGAYAALWGVD